MENVRYNISPCSADEVAGFIRKIDSKTFVPNGTVVATERSHYDRYSFLAGDNRIAVVYDTSANILSITGRNDFAHTLLELFKPDGKSVKSSTVPAQGSVPQHKREQTEIISKAVAENGKRAKLFVSPDSLRRRTEFAPVPTLFVTSKGAEISTDEIYPPQMTKKKERIVTPARRDGAPSEITDEIYPPQVVRKRPLPSYGESRIDGEKEHFKQQIQRSEPRTFGFSTIVKPENKVAETPQSDRPVGLAITVGNRTQTGIPRRTKISFGTEDDGKDRDGLVKINTRPQQPPVQQVENTEKRKRGRPPKNSQPDKAQQVQNAPAEKRKRGRPPKNQKPQNDVSVGSEHTAESSAALEYKNGYSVKNFPPQALDGALSRLRELGKIVDKGEIEFAGTVQEVKSYAIHDGDGQKVIVRYATKRKTLQLQGKRSNLFGEVMSQVSNYSDYSSALENYVEESGGSAKKVSDVQNKLKKRLPTAFEFLSEQSRIDFSYGIHDFGQQSLHLSDYSVLLVPAFRGLERFVFDLQNAEGIKVKMIGQAFDKDDSGKYILKSGYTKRINSVIYAEVLVALYSEYFSQRNFFAHSDNTDSNISRSIPERAAAQKIFEHLLDVVEYNAKKLKEIGYSIK